MDVKNFVPGAGVVNVPTGELENVEIPQPISIEQSVPKHAVEEKVGRVRMSPIRKAIAKNMTHQKQEIPHVTLFDEVEVSKLMAHRAQFKAAALEEDTKLTYLAYVVKAQAAVNKKFPELNAHADMANFEIIYPESIHIGIAVDTPLGLFVPVVRNADQKSILAIAKEIVDLAERARAGALTGDVASGSTVTISNIGSARGGWFTPVINVNESTILGLGTIQKQPIIDESGEIIVGNMMKLSLSFDHRLIDGMLAQRAMNYLKKLLEDPSYMLMEV
jgi:pyruvate dehydrogenase E2 component (dihydrolipoamide acetyltransferase)